MGITNESVDFESDDWAHVSSNTKQLVGKLLSKDPQHRANCNDIIKNVWKVQVSHIGFRKAHNKFKQTVAKRMLGQRASFDDNNVKLSHEQTKKRHRGSHEKQKKWKKRTARD